MKKVRYCLLIAYEVTAKACMVSYSILNNLFLNYKAASACIFLFLKVVLSLHMTYGSCINLSAPAPPGLSAVGEQMKYWQMEYVPCN